MRFFDINAGIGRPMLRQAGAVQTATEYFTAVAHADIDGALLWHVTQRDGGPDIGNALLSREIAGEPRAWGCWTILPPQTDRDVMTDDFFVRLPGERIAALRLFPDMHRYVPDRATLGTILDVASLRRIPVLLSLRLGWDYPGVHRLLEDFPGLTCVLCDVGVWGQDRNTWPLLGRYDNVYLETSMVSMEAGGLEAAVRAWGAGRLVFGTGFPYHYAEAAVLDLLHADIAEEDKVQIASGNFRALTSWLHEGMAS